MSSLPPSIPPSTRNTGYGSGLTAQQHQPIDMGNGNFMPASFFLPEDVNMGNGASMPANLGGGNMQGGLYNLASTNPYGTDSFDNPGQGTGQPLGQIFGNMTNTNANGSSDPISSLYQSMLGRAPDEAGLQYWQQQLASGKPIQDIQNAFMQTSEYKQRQGQTNTNPSTQTNTNPSTAPNSNPYGITTSNQFASSTNPYIQAAQQTSLGNLAGAQTASTANRVNQNTPYSSLQYTQTGTDAQGNPIWSANQSLNPALQGTFNNLSGNLARSSANPFSVAGTQNQMVGQGPGFTNVGAAPNLQTKVNGTGMEGWDAATGLLMQRLQPQIDRSNAALDSQLANQGIMPGSEAYKTAKQQQAQGNNDLLTQAQLAGSQVQNTMFNQNLGAGQFTNQALTGQNTMNLGNTQFNNLTSQQGFANQLAGTQANNAALQNNYTQNLQAYNLPLTQLGAFNQATQPGYVNPYNQAATSGPDYLGAYATSNASDIAQRNYNNQLQLSNQNAANANSANLTSGLFNLAGAGVLAGGLPAIGNAATSAYNWLSNSGGSSGSYMPPEFGTGW